jgi:hypothetical protein
MSHVAELSPSQKAHKTARWARIMTKWLVTYSCKTGVKWRFVEFGGRTGAESYGIVDIVAIRKNHRPSDPDVKRGDLFEIVLIQAKGGSAPWPSESDIDRLAATANFHRAEGRRPCIMEIGKESAALSARRSHLAGTHTVGGFCLNVRGGFLAHLAGP